MQIMGLAHLITFSLVVFGAVNLNEGGGRNIIRPTTFPIDRPTTISARLIHRDSVIPPPLTMDSSDGDQGDLRAQTLPFLGRALFLVNISIGQPPLPQLLVIDTGSSLTVVRPVGCVDCESEVLPLYDSSDSSTFQPIYCPSSYCSYLHGWCDDDHICNKQLAYADRREGYAALSSETFTFLTSDGGFVSVPKIVFGAADELRWRDFTGSNGILGLGPETTSLTRLYSKFSYCIGSVNDRFYAYNSLVIGEKARLEGSSTPMDIFRQYLLTLEGITVGENALDLMPEVLAEKVIIDAGAEISYLIRDAYELLKKEIKRVLEGKLHLISDENMCYEGGLRRGFTDFPPVTLHFAEGANLVIEARSLFQPRPPNLVCLAIKKVVYGEAPGVTILGMSVQQNHYIGYDLLEERLYIQKTDCQYLED